MRIWKWAPAAMLLLAACGERKVAEPATETAAAPAEVITVSVPAVAETLVPDNPTVDADDPVLWRDPADPARALWIGTDKSKGLYVHDMAGRMLQFFPDGPVNNVDQRSFAVGGKPTALVAASEREKFGVMTWLIDPATLKLSRWGFLPTEKEFGEPYGFCMGQFGGETFAIANNKAGEVRAYAISVGAGGKPAMALKHKWKLGSQTEGCVVNDETGELYVGEEDVGIWRMSLADAAAAPVKIAPVDGSRLVADVEGLTIMRDGARQFLIASSQGDSAFAVWEIKGGEYAWAGRFRVAGGSIDPVTETDGVDAWSGPIAGFPEGAIAMHDTCDGEGPNDPDTAVCESDGKQQNYKLVDWRDVKKALSI
ncbi:phytase [Sandaracinobacter sp. RS1-74]|uniref:phytase n=1 Tax=Sandaracinobacteroides sayramensis TaxID=2913411 RepID=UPI001EDBF053|nr:phytase [Sandaracinobacteroides sayramensis]MCG2842747.1 phytase [Sandaracinobacteroides sayramensis]